MSTKVLFWYEENTVGWPYQWADYVCNYYGAGIIVIDTLGHFKGPHAFKTLEDAIKAHEGYKLVFLDPRGNIILDEFEHPTGDVMYLTGSYVKGFGDFLDQHPGIGDIVRLRNPAETFALLVGSIVLHDRELFLMGRKA